MNRAGVDLRGPHGRRRFGRLPLVVVALIATGLSLGWSFRSAPPRLALGFSVREETLDETGWFSSAALAVSSDGRHVAWGRHEGSTVRMVVDGKAGRAFDGLSLQPPRFAAAPGSGCCRGFPGARRFIARTRRNTTPSKPA